MKIMIMIKIMHSTQCLSPNFKIFLIFAIITGSALELTNLSSTDVNINIFMMIYLNFQTRSSSDKASLGSGSFNISI